MNKRTLFIEISTSDLVTAEFIFRIKKDELDIFITNLLEVQIYQFLFQDAREGDISDRYFYTAVFYLKCANKIQINVRPLTRKPFPLNLNAIS